MATDSGTTAGQLIARLRELERRGSARVEALRQTGAPPARRHGLLFRLADHRLLTPVNRVTGVRPLPRTLTTVPGAARWVLGIANHRGELLPIYDLRGLLLADYEGIQRRGIALVVAGERRAFGLVVDAVTGLRRTRLLASTPPDVEPPASLTPLIAGACECAEGVIPVIDPAAVERLQEFQTGAITSGPGLAMRVRHPTAER
jgi:twitching motility protein PilI